MDSDVAIVNMALSRVGQSRISSLTESGQNAQLCNLYYEPTKEELLSSFDFSFARDRVELMEYGGDNFSEYTYKYTLPTTSLRILNLLNSKDYSDTTDPWRREGKYILTNVSPCFVKFTKKITNPSQMPQTFIEALYLRLASKLIVKVTQDQKLFGPMFQEFTAAMQIAMAVDGSTQQETESEETLWSS